MSEYKDITQLEIAALKGTYNLSDAHTHQSQSSSQLGIVRRLPDLWIEAQQARQFDLEQTFIKTFFRVQRQQSAIPASENVMLTYSASISMMIVATFLKRRNISAALMHPCFDNLYDLLVYADVDVRPLQEHWLHDSRNIYKNLTDNVDSDSIILVDPNNPTGFTLSIHGEEGWAEFLRYAKDAKKLLIFDFSFSAFMLDGGGPQLFDRYELLDRAGVSYVAIEDTGKTWPLQDAKVSLLKMSKDLYQDFYDIHSAVLLDVSPFILHLVTQYVRDSENDHFRSVFGLLNKNRAAGTDLLAGTILEPLASPTSVSVLWCRIKDPHFSATALAQYLASHDIHVLPGTYFFWNKKSDGDEYIRIALARDPDVFLRNMEQLVTALSSATAGN